MNDDISIQDPAHAIEGHPTAPHEDVFIALRLTVTSSEHAKLAHARALHTGDDELALVLHDIQQDMERALRLLRAVLADRVEPKLTPTSTRPSSAPPRQSETRGLAPRTTPSPDPPCDNDAIETRPVPGAGALVLDSGGRWFQPPSGRRGDLRDRPAMRNLLVRLTTYRVHAPGEAVPVFALVRAGWPGVEINPDAARNRLRVALARLRRLGLGDLLRSHGDGYLLDPRLEVHIAGDAALAPEPASSSRPTSPARCARVG